MKAKRIVVIGGSAAGAKAASKARRMDQDAEISIIQKDAEFSMAACGYPYYVEGVIKEREMLISSPAGAVRDSGFFKRAKGIEAISRTEAVAIDRKARKVTCRNLDSGDAFDKEYDKLIVATGAAPFMPPIPGIDFEGVTTLHSLRDADYLRKIRDEKKVRKAVVLGGGLIGIEACEALTTSRLKVTVVELLPQIMPFLDREMAKLVENYLRTKAGVITGNQVAEFQGEDGKLTGVVLASGEALPCEVAVIAVGVRPETKLAADAGLEIGQCGGIAVDEYMQTSDPDIYAVGDCVEILNTITGKPTLAPFGDLANLEGRVAGQNVITGNKIKFKGTVQTGICKVFRCAAGSTGLSETKARAAGFTNIVSAIWAGPDRPHFMKGQPLVIKMTADADTGRVLGVQCFGEGDVSKRIAVAAVGLQAGFTVEDFINLDLPYAPPFSPAIDPIITTAHILENKMLGRMQSVTSTEAKERLDSEKDLLFLDVRQPAEFEAARLGIGEMLIPLGALRERLDELPDDKDKEIVCYCAISLRGYEAAGLLKARGWKNAKVLEGGIAAWPYAREK